MNNIKYLQHIDGLRALAILMVLLFHFKVPYFDRGYIGVDIFFTISGFLMTKIIVEDNNFSFKSFYTRRIFRLLPSLFTVILFTLFFGIYFFDSIYLKELAFSSIFSIISLSNFFFWSVDDYFAFSSELKPLLHIWSLSLEEQFYLFFPIFLIFIKRLQRIMEFLCYLVLLSFLFSYLWFFLNFDERINTSYFYLLPFRIYQFIIGAIGYIIFCNSVSNNQEYKKNLTYKFTIYISIGVLILFSSNLFSQELFENQFFLGISISLIVIFIICFSKKDFFTTKILSSKISRFIGKISYSLYLVHWPIWVFSYNINNYSVRLVLSTFLTILLSFLLHKIVEVRMRIK